MKYVARVQQVLQPGINKTGTIVNGRPVALAEMPLPDRVEIELEGRPDQPVFMYRYTRAGDFCGDSWHENLRDAFAQAEYEYGLSEEEFVCLPDE